MKSVEKTGKTIDNAITDALIELGATTDQVEIQVLERGSKGFLGFGAKNARVRVALKELSETQDSPQSAEEDVLDDQSEEAIKEPEQVINVCKSLGAEIIESKFDLCAVFYLFPNYLVTLNIWFADEEFEASGKMLVDKSADHYLTMEDSVMVGEFMLRCISERYKQLYDAF